MSGPAASATVTRRQASEDLRWRGDAGREEGRPSRQDLWAERRLRGALYVRARPARRPVSVDSVPHHHDADRPPSEIEVPLAPLSKHVAYLKREGVTRDGADARMFDARSDDANTGAFAERCENDRHHFRFTVSPEDAAEMADLRTFIRELMADA
jgi:hypothetical protein